MKRSELVITPLFRSILTCLLGSFLASILLACATTHTISIKAQTPVIGLRRLPLTAAIIIPETTKTTIHHTSLNGCLSADDVRIPSGEALEKGILPAMMQAFDDIELVREKASAIDQHDFMVELDAPKVTVAVQCSVFQKVFSWLFWMYGVTPTYDMQTTAEVTFTVYDKSGNILMPQVQASSMQQRRSKGAATPYVSDTQLILDSLSGAMADALSEAIQTAVRGMMNSEDVRRYASAAVKQPYAVNRPFVNSMYASRVHSDVDEPPATGMKQRDKAHAIVIGIEHYRQKLPNADYAARDAQIVTEYLKAMGYPQHNIVTLLNERALKSDLEKYFGRWLADNVEEGGSVFIYYSGHGTPNLKTGDAYLVPYDGDPSFLDETGYPLNRLYESLSKLKAKDIVVALDSCFSGAGGRSVIAKGARPLVMNPESTLSLGRNMIAMTAASSDQISSTYEEQGHGLFTYFLLKGMGGAADMDKDGRIEVRELFEYIMPRVQHEARTRYHNEQVPRLLESPGWNVGKKFFLME